MLQTKRLDDCIGHELKAVVDNWGGRQLLVFEDRVACLTAVNNYDDIEIEEIGFNPLDFDNGELIAVGVTTAEELAALKEARSSKWEKDRVASERSEYARLHAKYGSVGGDGY